MNRTLLNLATRKYDLDSLDNRDPEFVEQFLGFVRKPLRTYFRSEVRGLQRIPTGAGLYVGNHNGGLLSADSFIFGSEVQQVLGLDDLPYGLGHEMAISLPGLHQFLVPLGAVRASHENAHRLFRRDRKVLVYPGGDLEAMRPSRNRDRIVFGGRVGYIQLALRGNVPIIPVVASGAHDTFYVLDDMRWLAGLLGLDRLFRLEVWPLMFSIPWGLTLGPAPPYIPFPTRIVIEVLKPIRFRPRKPDAAEDDDYVRRCAARVETSMQEAMDRLAAERT